MIVRLSRLVSPVSVLGPGLRAGLWVQGCTLACAGCASVDTWDPNAGIRVDVEVCAEQLLELFAADSSLTGLSITGGEPVQQGESVAELIKLVREASPAIDVLLFTGYTLASARRKAPALLDSVDAVIAGPYRGSAGFGGPLLGSANQRLHILTPVGHNRFVAQGDGRSTLQVTAIGDELLLIGIPKPGDLDRLEDALLERGISFQDVTWRT